MLTRKQDNFIRKNIFLFSHSILDKSFSSRYYQLQKNQWRSREELNEEQEKNLHAIIKYSYENVPYYSKLFKKLKLKINDVKTIEDLNKLPILTKDTIKNNYEDFKPVHLQNIKYYYRSTGGSTGTPFQYRLSKNDRFISAALLYRGWGYAGYKIGDKMGLIGGSSLDIGKKSDFKRIIDEYLRNIRKFSSFDFDEKNLTKYGKIIETFRPKYLYGYASSIYFFSKWLEINGISINPLLGVITTAENLFPHMRRNIESVFQCKVFNAYGLNDGGVSAFECGEHIGLHIDTERSIMEVVDGDGLAVDSGEGQILATSLHNYAMPFIRYTTGDEGFLLDEPCACCRGYPLLKEVLGRQQEMLVTPEGKHIHGEYITHIFWEIPHVKEFQVVQKEINQLTFNVVPEEGFDEKSLDYVRSVISSRSKGWNIDFQFVDAIDRSQAGKYKFIINEVADV